MNLSLQNLFRATGKFLGRHRTKILTGAAIGGVGVTAVLAGKAAIQAHEKIIETEIRNEVELTPAEKVKMSAPFFIKTAVSGILTGTAIVAAVKGEHKIAMTYAGLYAVSEATVNDLQNALVDKMGEEAANNFKSDILKKKAEIPEEEVKQQPVYVLTSDDPLWFKDTGTNEMLHWVPSRWLNAEREMNHLMRSQDYGSMNDLRSFEGRESVRAGDDEGWNIRDGGFSYVWGRPDFDATGRFYIPISYSREPRSDYDII